MPEIDRSFSDCRYGYLTFFAVSFPLVSIFALFSNTVEIRTDASKLCKASQRPLPEGAEDIGCWMSLLTVMSFMSVTSNCAMIFFSSQFISEDQISPAGRVAGFILLEHVLLLFQVTLAAVVDDVPQSVNDLSLCIKNAYESQSAGAGGGDDAAEKLFTLQRRVGNFRTDIGNDIREEEDEESAVSLADRVNYVEETEFPRLKTELELCRQYVFDAVCFAYTCRRLIDLSRMIAGTSPSRMSQRRRSKLQVRAAVVVLFLCCFLCCFYAVFMLKTTMI